MDPLTIAAASGIRSRAEALDLLGNNLANAGTAGFKADQEFYRLYLSPESGENLPSDLPNIETHWTDFSQGTLANTDSPTDLGLEGEGFFVIGSPSGVLLTRSGNFRVSSKGRLETADGLPVLSANRKDIMLATNLPIEVTASGEVFQARKLVASLQISAAKDKVKLRKQGASNFLADEANLQPARGVQVHQGKLETANVAPAESAVKLVTVMRQFESLQRALSLGNEMNKRAVEEVAKVGA